MTQTKLFLLALIISLASVPCIWSQEWITWTEHPDNPIFDPDSRAYYPCIIFDTNLFNGTGSNAPYKIWYQTESDISHAYSINGVDWIVVGSVSGLVSSASHPWVLYNSDGFGDGVYYKIWYWTGIGEISGINAIHYAESSDGVTWINDQSITQDATYPLVDNIFGDWWYHLYGPACLLYESDAGNTGGYPYDYSYVMFFDTAFEGGGPDGIEAVALAFSSDGKHWTRYSDEPILYPSIGEWDSEYVTRGTVLKLPSGRYGFWYSGGVSDSNDGIGYAESVDGLNWIKNIEPLMHQNDVGYPGYPWRSDRTYTPMVIYDSSRFSGYGDSLLYKMWYSGKNPDNGKYTVGVTYGILEVTVGGSLVRVDVVELNLLIIVSGMLLLSFLWYKREK